MTCYLYNRIYARQMKSNSLKSGESKLSCSKLTLHSFQSEKFMAQIWWSDCKLLQHMHKSIAALPRGSPLSMFWQSGLICDQRLEHRTRIQFSHWHLCYDLLNWPEWMAVQYLCCTHFTHTLYCYNWTFHCFPTPDILYMLRLFNR